MKNKEDFLDEALKVVVRDSADDFFYIDDDGIIQSEYTIEEIRDENMLFAKKYTINTILSICSLSPFRLPIPIKISKLL
jgi:hypothetical protein